MSPASSALSTVAKSEAPVAGFVSRWPQHETDEIAAAVRVLSSGRVNALVHGDQTRAFEEEFAAFVGMPHALAVSNGTVSLELALRAFGIGPGDEVIIPARSFFATASCVAAVGAEPVFADVLGDEQTIDPASAARVASPRTRALICVHLAGRPCAMDELVALCEANGWRLIEDCAQAHGARYHRRRVGSFGHASSFSFCTDKIMSTGGEGGMVLFGDEDHWARASAYKDHGKDPRKLRMSSVGKPGEFRYLHDSFGTNFRMTEFQAAIGRRQLTKLPQWLASRRANARCLAAGLEGLPGVIVDEPPHHVESACYKFYVRLDPERLPRGLTRGDVISGLQARGIPCGSGSCPDMSREVAFAGRPPRRDGDLPQARRLGETSLMFPVDHLLGEQEMMAVVAAMREVLA